MLTLTERKTVFARLRLIAALVITAVIFQIAFAGHLVNGATLISLVLLGLTLTSARHVFTILRTGHRRYVRVTAAQARRERVLSHA